VVITQIQPIGVLFSIPEDRLALVLRRMQGGTTLPVDAYDRDGRIKLASGKLVTVDNQIDPTTGTIKLKAEFANENGALFPNQFVNVRMEVDTLKNSVVILSSAVQRGNQGTFVYVVNDDSTVTVRPVKLGPVQGETTVVESGLAAGERIVTDGADKLRDGAKIEAITPGATAAAPGVQRPQRQGGGQGRRNGDNAAGAGAGVPTVPGGAAPAGNDPATNQPGAGAPAAPPPVRPSPSG
jgi:multidrug efflux system membrane fusion protein